MMKDTLSEASTEGETKSQKEAQGEEGDEEDIDDDLDIDKEPGPRRKSSTQPQSPELIQVLENTFDNNHSHFNAAWAGYVGNQ